MWTKNVNSLSRHLIDILGLTLLFFIYGCSQTEKNEIHKQISNTMNYRASFCDPFQKDIIELGDISKDSIIDKFEKTPWADFLMRMANAKEDEIYYSPSLEIENKDTKHGLAISAVGDPNNYEFYIFYKRPKKIKSFFGLKEKVNDSYTSDKTGQTKQDVLDCLKALLNNDREYLSNTIGQ
ncbi:hypothetical protein GCM10022408_38180 [Hymenobacter fastidiosus]|uniref:Lipoprotein n=1 Tax=Hymenobacter fastidiosus TaxID=486264 RepID=A0ABP7T5I7_9BACT